MRRSGPSVRLVKPWKSPCGPDVLSKEQKTRTALWAGLIHNCIFITGSKLPDQLKCCTNLAVSSLKQQSSWLGRAEVYSSFGRFLPARLASFCQILEAKNQARLRTGRLQGCLPGRTEDNGRRVCSFCGEQGQLLLPRGNISVPDIWLCGPAAAHCSPYMGPFSLKLNRYWDPNINMTLISCQFFHDAVFPGPYESCWKKFWWLFYGRDKATAGRPVVINNDTIVVLSL